MPNQTCTASEEVKVELLNHAEIVYKEARNVRDRAQITVDKLVGLEIDKPDSIATPCQNNLHATLESIVGYLRDIDSAIRRL